MSNKPIKSTDDKPSPSNSNDDEKLDIHKPIMFDKNEIDIAHIDTQLLGHYKGFGREGNWYDKDSTGKFQSWADESGYDTSGIQDDMTNALDEIECINFDGENWPVGNLDKDTETSRKQRRFDIMQLILNGWPRNFWLWIEDIKFGVTDEQMELTFKLYNKHIKKWGNEAKMDLNTLHFLACSMYNTPQNLLIYLVDIYKRDTLEEMVKAQRENKDVDTDVVNMGGKEGEYKRFKEWLKKYGISRRLQKKYDTHNRTYDVDKLEQAILSEISTGEVKSKNETKLSFQAAILTYIKRIGSRLLLNSNLVQDNLKQITTIIAASREFIDIIGFTEILKKEQLNSPPFIVDFMIVLPPSVRDEKYPTPKSSNEDNKNDKDDEDDEPDTYGQNEDIHYNQDIIGDLFKHLNATNTLYKHVTVQNPVDLHPLRQGMKECYEEFKDELGQSVNQKTYPQHHRLNVIFDRREKDKQENDIIIFQPPDDCNKIPKEQIPPELYGDLSRRCLIPRSDDIKIEMKEPEKKTNNNKSDQKYDVEHWNRITTEDLNATTAAQGQLMTFSYHVREKNDIKCYLLWNGQNHRFYPQDILDVFPEIFKMDEKEKEEFEREGKEELKKMIAEIRPFTDTKFEQFYGAIKQKLDFPKVYGKNQDYTTEIPTT